MARQIARKAYEPDLGLLKSFLAVVECGGFTAAAARVHRTQSTISQQVRKLEDELGLALLERTSSGVSPTNAGEQVLAYARRMLALGNELGDVIAGNRRSVNLRLGITDDYAQLHLSGLLDRLTRAYPQVKPVVTCALSNQLREGLGRGEYDLIIYKRTTAQGEGTRILREPMQWVASKRYRASADDPLALILFPEGCVYRQRAIARLNAANLRWRVVFESPSSVSVQAAVRAGLGIAILTPSSLPAGCAPVALRLPVLGDAELVYQFGDQPPAEAADLLKELVNLARA